VLRIWAAALSALCLAGCGGDDKEPQPRAETETETAASTPAVDEWGCAVVNTPVPNNLKLAPPTAEPDPATTYVAVVETNCGRFEITLDAERAPKTAASFMSLAKHKFYNGTTIHRIVPNSVIQGGDPTGAGTGGPGYTVREPPPKDVEYTKGVVAMAKTEQDPAGTSGSQFFIVTGPDGARLAPEYAPLGKVTKGEDVVARIGGITTDPSTYRPDRPIVFLSISIDERQ
jgi:cyclophilin family peptidyl-prolyl cis-trans isomerase